MAEKLIFDAPIVDKKEILRYMGCKTPDENILSLLEECLTEALPSISYSVPEIIAANGASSAMNLAEANAAAAAKGIKVNDNDVVAPEESPVITSSALSEEFPNYASSLLNLVKNSEARIQLINRSDK